MDPRAWPTPLPSSRRRSCGTFHLPVQPKAGETIPQYNQRLFQIVSGLDNPTWVDGKLGSFQYHPFPFKFGPTEFAGLKIFLKAANGAAEWCAAPQNAAACHLAPNFSDFSFHNTGVSQEEYDAAHGAGAFMSLTIPSLDERNASYDLYLPATANHPIASETFRRAADAGHAGFADLGLWNVYLNPDMPSPQADLKSVVCAERATTAPWTRAWPTPLPSSRRRPCATLPGLAVRICHDGGKLHAGRCRPVLRQQVSQLARQGQLRNAPAEFRNMVAQQRRPECAGSFPVALSPKTTTTPEAPEIRETCFRVAREPRTGSHRAHRPGGRRAAHRLTQW